MTYDAIIIGSGVSGMTVGTILAKHRYKILIVEQCKTIGGLMQTFRRGRCHFSAGIHCLGALGQGQIMWKYFKYMGLTDHIKPVAIDSGCFARLLFPGLKFDIPSGHEAFTSKLVKKFPAEKTAISQFFKDMKCCASQFPLYNLQAQAGNICPKFQNQSLKDYLNNLTDNEELYLILTALNPFYCINPDGCPLYIHFLTIDSFLKSSWRLDETETTMTDAFIKIISELGGEIRNNSQVSEILTENGKAQGIRLTNNEVITGRYVIYTGHPKQLLSLCSDKQLRPAFRQRILSTEDTHGMFSVGLEWNNRDCPFSQHDVFMYLTRDTASHYKEKISYNDCKPNFIYFSAVPNSNNEVYSVTALCKMTYEELSQWHNTLSNKRPESYGAMKEKVTKKILSVIEDTWPGSIDFINVKTTYTPLTIRDYTFSPTGSAYGLKRTVNNLKSTRLSVMTKVKGLYMSGQSVVMSGILGSLISSVNCCGAILGTKELIREISDSVQ